jgi:hypothetical protein
MGSVGCDTYGLADDRDGDGTWTLSDDLKITVTDAFAKTTTAGVPRWGVERRHDSGRRHRREVRVPCLLETPLNWIDFVAVRHQTLPRARERTTCFAIQVQETSC